MEIERAREDLFVAASAGVTMVAIAVLSSVTAVVSVGTLPTLAPLAVYGIYLFSRKGGPYGSFDEPRNWAIAAVVVGAAVVIASGVF
ncbi:hypothetical protein [Halorubrum sp. HHNYT27]|uniref:hypothetical protein n=1 Tax=Halorubrum sp. HHNYT27 TaxID=3402275 RepID=UPI003EBA2F12